MKINFSQEKKNPNTLCTSLPHCLLFLLPYWAFLLKDFYRLLKLCSSRVVRSHDSVMYADRLKVMPWRFYQDKIIMSLLFIWGERKSKQNKSNTGILGLSVGCFLFSSNTLLSPRNKNMSVLEKEVRTLNIPLYMFALVVKYLDISHPWRVEGSQPSCGGGGRHVLTFFSVCSPTA